jgi:hypothetical protein
MGRMDIKIILIMKLLIYIIIFITNELEYIIKHVLKNKKQYVIIQHILY